DSRFALSGLGLALTELGEFDEALRVCRRAIAFKRGVPEGLGPIIGPLIGLGRMEEAREAARLLVESEPGYTLTVARSHLAPFVDCEKRIERIRSLGVLEG